jgi:hypothetical protein
MMVGACESAIRNVYSTARLEIRVCDIVPAAGSIVIASHLLINYCPSHYSSP